MLENEKWILDFQVPLFGRYDKLEKHLRSGVLYGYQRDKQNRPIIYYSIKRAIDLGMSEESQLDTLDFIASYTIQHALVPGKIETYNVVIDLADVSLMESPINMLRIMTSRLKIAYQTNIEWSVLKPMATLVVVRNVPALRPL